MPWTLYRYILWELLKLLGLTAAVLVTVMSFAAAIRPISDGLLSPGLLLKFVAFTAPTVLGFALPFAGAFASTLVFIRLAGDNEILACSASGLSYRRILLPVLALGLALTVLMFYLSNTIVPSFFRLAERTVDKDVVTLLVNQLDTGQPFVIREQDLVIYADAAEAFPPTEQGVGKLPMRQRVLLEGVSVGELDDANDIAQDTTAERAELAVYGDRDTDDAWVVLALRGVVRYDPATGGLGRVESLLSRPIRVPSPLRDNPKFFSASDLTRLSQHPETFDQVRATVQRLASALATESLRQQLVATMDRATLHGVLSGDRYVLSVPAVREEGELLRLESADGRPVRVELYTSGRTAGEPARTYRAESGVLKVRTSALNPEPTIDLELHNVEVIGRPGGPSGGDRLIPIRQLTWPTPLVRADAGDTPPAELLQIARQPAYAASPRVAAVADGLRAEIDTLRREITGHRHERAASAVSCMLLLLLGAALSIQMRGRTPLVVYFWSFLLAIVTIVIVNSGQNVASGTGYAPALGLTLLWSGNALLLVVLSLVYRKLARH